MTPKILCVDDDPSIRTMLQKVLSAESYDVVLAIDGEEALSLASRENPDLMLQDIQLESTASKRSAGSGKTTPMPS